MTAVTSTRTDYVIAQKGVQPPTGDWRAFDTREAAKEEARALSLNLRADYYVEVEFVVYERRTVQTIDQTFQEIR